MDLQGEMEHSGTEQSEFIGRRTLSQHLEKESRQIRQLFLKRAFGIIVYLRLLQMLLFVFLFICWVKNILK